MPRVAMVDRVLKLKLLCPMAFDCLVVSRYTKGSTDVHILKLFGFTDNEMDYKRLQRAARRFDPDNDGVLWGKVTSTSWAEPLIEAYKQGVRL